MDHAITVMLASYYREYQLLSPPITRAHLQSSQSTNRRQIRRMSRPLRNILTRVLQGRVDISKPRYFETPCFITRAYGQNVWDRTQSTQILGEVLGWYPSCTQNSTQVLLRELTQNLGEVCLRAQFTPNWIECTRSHPTYPISGRMLIASRSDILYADVAENTFPYWFEYLRL